MGELLLFLFFFHFNFFHSRKRIQMEDPDDVLLWGKLNAWIMSDEESDGENGRMFTTLPWRSEEAADLLNRIYMALGVVRKYGDPSERTPNNKCQEFLKEGVVI